MAKYKLPFGKSVKSDHNQNFWYFQNIHIKTTNIFSIRSSPDPPIFKKIVVRSSPDPAKIGFSPDPCSSLVETLNKSRLREIYDIDTSEDTFIITITLKNFQGSQVEVTYIPFKTVHSLGLPDTFCKNTSHFDLSTVPSKLCRNS